MACNEPGIFYTRNPIGATEITADMWFSSYKDVEAPWNGVTIPCQVCLAKSGNQRGATMLRMTVERGTGALTVSGYTKYVCKMSKADFEAMIGAPAPSRRRLAHRPVGG